MTGGFLWGFLALAILGSVSKSKLPSLGLSLTGLAICHLAGILQFMLLTHRGFAETAMLVSVPFILKDIVSVILALLLSIRLRPLLKLSDR